VKENAVPSAPIGLTHCSS